MIKKQTNLKRKIFTNFFIVMTSLSFSQSPWTREKNKIYAQLGFTSLIYKKVQIDGKTIDLNSNFTDITTQIYAEYGISNNLEAQLIVPFKYVNNDPNIGSNQQILGLGNIIAGLKYKLLDKTWKLSAGLQYSSNSITKYPCKDLTTGFNSSTILPYLSVGSSHSKWYYFGNLGYGYMTNDYSDFFKFGAEVGYNITQKSHLILILDNRIIVSKEAAFFNDVNQWASYLDRQSFSAVGLKYNYEFKKEKFGANFAVISAFALNNVPVAPTFNLGIYSKF